MQYGFDFIVILLKRGVTVSWELNKTVIKSCVKTFEWISTDWNRIHTQPAI